MTLLLISQLGSNRIAKGHHAWPLHKIAKTLSYALFLYLTFSKLFSEKLILLTYFYFLTKTNHSYETDRTHKASPSAPDMEEAIWGSTFFRMYTSLNLNI